MFHRYRIWAIESFPSFSLLESWSKISPRAMRFQKKMKEENFEPRSDERKLCYRSPQKRKRQLVRWLMPGLEDRSNRLFFSLQRRSLTFSFIIFLHYLSFSWSHHQEVVFDRRSEMKFQDNFKMRSMKRESEGKFICLFYFFSIILDGQIVDLQANSLFAIKIIWLKEIRRQMVSL